MGQRERDRPSAYTAREGCLPSPGSGGRSVDPRGGAPRGLDGETFLEADVVLMLDPPYMLRTWRIIRRFFRQKAGLESANYRPSLKIFLRMFRWNRHFEKVEKRKFLQSEAGLLPKTKRVTRWSGDLENLDSLVRRRDMG